MRKLLTVLTALCLAAAPAGIAAAADEGPALEEKALELEGVSLRFPAVTGMADEALQAQVNARIREDLGADAYLERVSGLISDSSRTLTVTWNGMLSGDVFSTLLEAETATGGRRASHSWAWSSIDLRDGHEITLGELFTDEAAGRERLETLLEETVAPELSAHLERSGLTPLPAGFRLEKTGLTLLYDGGQLCTLTGRAGAVKIGWNEIRDCVDWSADGIPARVGAAEMTTLTGESAARIRETAESGQLPDIPVKIGDSVKEWTDRTGLLYDPEEYSGGRMFAPEGAAFRGVYLLSDALTASWTESRVQGIRMDRGCLWGLCVGETTAEEWRQVLGEPDYTVAFDAEEAEYARTVPGNCDYYLYGDYRLQLQADEEGVLSGITLAQ